MGGKGSGMSRDATEAVEGLLAAVLRDDDSAILEFLKELDIAHRFGRSKMSGKKVLKLLQKAANSLAFDVADAEAQPNDHLGDVKVTLRTGEFRWIEVKAQTKKTDFAEIVQADYVRDGTDFLRRYDSTSNEFSLRMDPDLRLALELDKPIHSLKSWSLEDLWIADLALLDTEKKKTAANLKTGSDLPSFLERKYLVHLCTSGLRYVRLDNLGPIKAIGEGKKIETVIKTNRASTAAIQISAGRRPGHASTDFTYHVGFKNSNAAGRHKLHNIAWQHSSDVKVFNA